MASTSQRPANVSDREHSKEVPSDAATAPIRERMQTTTKDRPAARDEDEPESDDRSR